MSDQSALSRSTCRLSEPVRAELLSDQQPLLARSAAHRNANTPLAALQRSPDSVRVITRILLLSIFTVTHQSFRVFY